MEKNRASTQRIHLLRPGFLLRFTTPVQQWKCTFWAPQDTCLAWGFI